MLAGPKKKCKNGKTYNSRYSLVVTHPTTNLPACGLSTAERTGSPVFHTLWSYVFDTLDNAECITYFQSDLQIEKCSPHSAAIGPSSQGFLARKVRFSRRRSRTCQSFCPLYSPTMSQVDVVLLLSLFSHRDKRRSRSLRQEHFASRMQAQARSRACREALR